MAGGWRPGTARWRCGGLAGSLKRSRQEGLRTTYATKVTSPSPTAVVNRRAVSLRVSGSGAPAPGAGAGAARPSTPVPARPASAGPTPAGATASAPPAPSAGSAPSPPFPPRSLRRPRPDHRHHGQGEQAQRDVPMPPGPTADFVLIQAAVALGQLKALLDRPACPGNPNQGREARARRPAAGEVGHLLGVGHAPPDQQPPGVGTRVGAVGPEHRPVVHPRPLRPAPTAEPVPPVRRHLGEQRLRPHLAEP